MAPGSRPLRDFALVACAVALCGSAVTGNREIADVGQAGQGPDFHDSHFHLTNYIQEGTDVRRFLQIMGTRTGRSTLFGIPLQQTWSFANSGDFAPTYYLQIGCAALLLLVHRCLHRQAYFKSLTPAEQARFDPMITGFNPADMYAADHIRRVLRTFPGVFTGIGEFTIHKEFVSSKVAGRGGQPHQSRARSCPRAGGRRGARRDPA